MYNVCCTFHSCSVHRSSRIYATYIFWIGSNKFYKFYQLHCVQETKSFGVLEVSSWARSSNTGRRCDALVALTHPQDPKEPNTKSGAITGHGTQWTLNLISKLEDLTFDSFRNCVSVCGLEDAKALRAERCFANISLRFSTDPI